MLSFHANRTSLQLYVSTILVLQLICCDDTVVTTASSFLQVLELLESHFEECMPSMNLEHIDSDTLAAERHAIVQRFNAVEG